MDVIKHKTRKAGPGRTKSANPARMMTFRAPKKMADLIDSQECKTEFLCNCVMASEEYKEMEKEQLGEVTPFDNVKPLELPYVDRQIVAGFPIPLDSDEHAERINLWEFLCPNKEASYLVQVRGNSMIDANINDGDLLIVDKSQRSPSREQIAICEWNGEYTVKRFEKRGKKAFLIPANPDYPEMEIKPGDNFSVWGVVTYVIHKL